MSRNPHQERIQAAAAKCGLDHVVLDGVSIEVSPFRRALQETMSREVMCAIARTTMKAMAVSGALDGILETQGIDLLHGSLFDLVAALGSHAADVVDSGNNLAELAQHGHHVVDAAATATDMADAAMGVATGGLSILTSVAASYFVGKFVGAKRDQRQQQLQLATAELIRRQSYAALRQALRAPGCAPKDLAQPVLMLLKAGDAPATLK